MKFMLTMSVKVFLLGAALPLVSRKNVAVAQSEEACEGAPGSTWNGQECVPAQGSGPSIEDLIGTITDTLLFIIGAVSVIMIIVGGFQYVVSGGDSSKVEKAKNTILYAVVGLVVAIVSFALVNFVLTNL